MGPADVSDRVAYWTWAYRARLLPDCEPRDLRELFQNLPYGYALCVVNVVGCIWTTGCIRIIKDRERELGDYSPSRYAWVTDDRRRLREPVPVTGHQGLFNLTAAEEARLRGSGYVSC